MGLQQIERLQVRGFKTFADAAVDLKACNVLIGGNGAGKSSLLSLLRMLRALARGELQVYVGKAGGANDVLHRSVPPTSALDLELDLITVTGKSRYRLRAERTEDDALLVRSEQVERWEFDGRPRGGEASGRPLRESRLVGAARGTGEQQLLGGLRVYHFAETATAAPASHECDLDDNRELREDGGNLAAFLYALEQQQPIAYRRIVTTTRQVLAGFGDFVLHPSTLNPGRIRLRWRLHGEPGDFGAHQLSDGTLRMILLTALLHQPPAMLPPVIAIDEPELGLHPAALSLAAALVRVAGHHCQVIIATQSAALLDHFTAEDTVVVRRPELSRGSTLERLSPAALADWLAEYSLGELWEKNVLGGGAFG